MTDKPTPKTDPTGSQPSGPRSDSSGLGPADESVGNGELGSIPSTGAAPGIKAAGLMAGFSSWGHACRFVAAIAILSAILCALLLLSGNKVISIIGNQDSVEVTFSSKGATIVSLRGQPRKALFSLPSGVLWADTGIKVKPGQKIVITASGRVNLALHRLVEAADKDKKPRHGWVGPGGGAMPNPTRIDEDRAPLKIHSREEFGVLLAYIRPSGGDTPGKKTSVRLENLWPDEARVIGLRNDITFDSKHSQDGTLFLTVNEAVLANDQKSQDAYVSTQEKLNEAYGEGKITVKTMLERWESIVDNKYWNVWFDDNFGSYLIQVEFDEH